VIQTNGSTVQLGTVTVTTTSGRGLPIEHWADRCLERIIHVADNSNSILKDQAIAFKDDIRQVLIHYIAQAIKSDRTTLYNLLSRQGEREMAALLLTLTGDR